MITCWAISILGLEEWWLAVLLMASQILELILFLVLQNGDAILVLEKVDSKLKTNKETIQ